ncbi:hypothetical protein ABPG72_008735 [Tetrahymena utriculariae]
MGRRDYKNRSSSRSASNKEADEQKNQKRRKDGDRSRRRSASSSSNSQSRKRDKQKQNRQQSRSRSKENKIRNDKKHKKKQNKNQSRSSSSQSSSSSSSSSSSGSDEEAEKKQAEEYMKMTKMRQEIIERELQYKGEENPFGDKDIAETLNWGKNANNQNKSINEIMDDIQRVKQIRLQRKEDEKRLEEMKNKAIQEREEEQYQQWKEKEEKFHAYQARIRALVRITQGKETTVDKINKIFYIYRRKIKYSEHLDPIMSNVQAFIKKQDEEELEKILAQAINHHNQLQDPVAINDQQYKDESEIAKFSQFWESIRSITQYYLDEFRKRNQQKEVLPEFEQEIKAIFEGKNLEELLDLEKRINQNIQLTKYGSQEDQQYWQNMHKRLQLYKGDAILKNFYDYFSTHQNEFQAEDALEIEVENKPQLTEEQLLAEQIQIEYNEAEAHVYSPVLMPINEETLRSSQTQSEFTEQVTQLRQVYYDKILKRALKALENKREKESKLVDTFVPVIGGLTTVKPDREDVDAATLHLLEMEKKKPMEDGEQVFDDQQAIDDKDYNWSDKYKSKKPKYYNRVKLGFDWNKYNRAHYDSDNPPPKYVQGYKFNIFYPELVDMQKTPEYFLEPTDEQGCCIIRFTAGPPYEDVAFKIINKEWDYADKKGFKCYFNRGVLTLHFNFKRSISRR